MSFTVPRPLTIGLVATLLLLHFGLAVGSKLSESTTSDELVHLTAGFSYWQNDDYRLQPENGNLPQRWAALPAWLAGAKFPTLPDNAYWRTSDAWIMGHQFFYETGEDHFPRLMAGRMMIALFSVATGLLIFFWARGLFGDVGGLISLGFFALCPNFLAHGALVTSDVCMVFFLLAAVGAWWRHLHDGRARWWWLSAMTLGLAFVAKFSAVLLLPMMAVMGVVRVCADAPLIFAGKTFPSRSGKLGAIVVSGLGHGAVVIAVIWAFYGFRYSAFNPALPPALQFIRSWDDMMTGIGTSGVILRAMGRLHLLPEGFLYGMAYVIETVGQRAAFLNGEYSIRGWPSFFPWAFLLKTTEPVLLAGGLTALVVGIYWRGQSWVAIRAQLYRVSPLIALFVIYWITSITSHLNIGHRHILPTYPVWFIAAGVLGRWIGPRQLGRVAVVGALLGWQAVAAARIAPHYIAYFNEIGGGQDNGRFHLVDSSLDWGQDLPGLKTWLEQNNPKNEPVFLSYFGTGEPAYYKLRAQRLYFFNNFRFAPHYVNLEPGLYCLSATALAEVYSPVRGPWTAELEREYVELRALEPVLREYRDNPERRAELERDVPASRWQWVITRLDLLRLARLCHYLRLKKPEANVGYSIYIFRLSADEVHRATGGSLAEWAGLLEQAVTTRP